jgi:hypothetical protein
MRRCATGRPPARYPANRLPHWIAGIWQAAEKIVFSTTLASVPGARTRIEPTFDPAVVRRLKSAAEHDMTVGGADLAGRPLRPGWSMSCS